VLVRRHVTEISKLLQYLIGHWRDLYWLFVFCSRHVSQISKPPQYRIGHWSRQLQRFY
jgi:hypothetical protein